MLGLLLSIFLMVSAAAAATQADPSVNGGGHPTTIFLLAGQSNMAGRGGVVHGAWDGHVPPECQPSPLILRLNTANIWEPAREPLHSGIDLNRTVGIGPGMSFAHTVLRKDPSVGVIGLVPCAVGGTDIRKWARGGFLYSRLIHRSAAAARGGARIRGLLWYQGESDTVNLEDAREYRDRLRKFFIDVRSDLQLPALPIIQVALATKQGPFIEIVRKAQLGVDLPHVKTVDAEGLEVGYDHLHLTAAAEVELGKMLADAFLRPASASKLAAAPPARHRSPSSLSPLLFSSSLLSLSSSLVVSIFLI
ncbi:hypothetical protein DM860_006631 [Cuscuta australis]|uniref:Sialate O-acetylesterase domain-containing protein n=1 Tax=Cuscuta australis TaxID=267555 RepID=A0A328D8B0_9ASTE|nr:hypothetical protein DM860_006631 [Cuscuta australis]